MEIFAIGHSNYTFEVLVSMLKKYDINCVVDIRGVPYSRYNVQFNKEKLEVDIKAQGFTYIYMGREFGIKRETKESYINNLYADFEKVKYEKSFVSGLERLKKGCEMGYRIVLLGAMQEPIRCHRGILLGRALSEIGFDVKYILHEGGLATQDDIEEDLLNKYFSDRNQLSIDNLLGIAKSREEMIKEAYKLANKEIGIRAEGIGR